VIEEGKTGYVVETVSEAVEAIDRLPQISRAACRQAFETRFDAAHMAQQYERVYSTVSQRASGPVSTRVSQGVVHG
jgi:hypothetical protein